MRRTPNHSEEQRRDAAQVPAGEPSFYVLFIMLLDKQVWIVLV